MVKKEFKKENGVLYAQVSIDRQRAILQDTWLGGFDTQENFRKVLSFIASQIEEQKIVGWLADLREMEGYFDESSEWLSQELMPRAINAGLLKEAIVLPKNVFARLSTKETVLKIQDFELRQFHNYSQAEKWLNEAIEPHLANQYAHKK